uniref:Saccharomyces cerevisiae DYS 1 deoxyhypusine synthase n=1 Tax=Saccharomyces cerevisiae TaxID=4932 RepID=Q65ZS9_YEASX|nr:hypothetical protein - yeast (Saccharomyces cerevisiae) [Saccharomyces cerevisiae]BAA11252.1 unnamed protein product [Saccharomyces cerevisiae]
MYISILTQSTSLYQFCI